MVTLTKYGYHELTNKPSQEELNRYYSEKYYQNPDSQSYHKEYGPEELMYFNNKIEQKYQNLIVHDLVKENQSYSLLDIGCGEGFALSFFKKLGWAVTGIEYTDYACNNFNPDCSKNIITGDVQQSLQELIDSGKKFHLIWLDNVLEHVLDPFLLLTQLSSILEDNGALIVDVPNDFSPLQENALEKGFINNQFWVAAPDHISYFNKSGLCNVAAAAGWNTLNVLADFPIDWFLYNEHSNYNKNKTVGKQAHYARVFIDNLMHENSVEKTNKLYEAMADLGMGRQLIGFFTKA